MNRSATCFFSGYLHSVTFLRDKVPDFERHPFSIPAIRELGKLELHPKVTFLIGENGSGKSTIVEALAVVLGLNPEGGSRNFRFETYRSHSSLHEYLRPSRPPRRPKDMFFLRAESYFNVGTEIVRLDSDPCAGPPITPAYGGPVHERSHGESFFALFLNRFRGYGLYLLDEPEAALSPKRQLAFLSRLHELVNHDSQFVIATHSPIIMGYPDAIIYQLSENGIQQIAYKETEHYAITREFLSRPEMMLEILLQHTTTE